MPTVRAVPPLDELEDDQRARIGLAKPPARKAPAQVSGELGLSVDQIAELETPGVVALGR
jgi:hypothetical protein